MLQGLEVGGEWGPTQDVLKADYASSSQPCHKGIKIQGDEQNAKTSSSQNLEHDVEFA
jgi:hypothetical protein